jgi:hypothetical protein
MKDPADDLTKMDKVSMAIGITLASAAGGAILFSFIGERYIIAGAIVGGLIGAVSQYYKLFRKQTKKENDNEI